MKEIIFDVSSTGVVTVETKGFNGPLCDKVFQKLKMGKLVSETKTQDWFGGGGQNRQANAN